ncbi:RNA polymerase sigma factor [Micromonospora polyrhachis]|uniref:RNA polymerase sigma-70 factor (ECF subfamily) n=1 Tax=Micromonospora polyrhachis TaxID=1282883 RepID=A0A7W7WNC7_9ACTN|nr:sigma-70 family RNA polymerase sigma factor [Micromonospora polyrhachis]MBB4957093.1 RNA polymerase sigma-70 factor (ECF subfamily) [Micromonospora polyrhachis]
MDATVAEQQDADRRLLHQVAAGDQAALERLYARHGPALLAYAEGLLADRLSAEEALQDTLLAVWRAASSFEARSTVRTWLFGICRRQALRRMRGRTPVHLPIDVATEQATGEPGPEAVTLARADARAVATALAGLTPIHREVLDLAFGAGLAHDEIAAVLDVPVGTVKSRLHHARAILARALPVEADQVPETSRPVTTRGGHR